VWQERLEESERQLSEEKALYEGVLGSFEQLSIEHEELALQMKQLQEERDAAVDGGVY